MHTIQRDVHRQIIHTASIIVFVLITAWMCAYPCTAADETRRITFSYSGVGPVEERQTLTVELDPNWFLQPDNQYNHKLMQASFGLAVASFRSRVHPLDEKDHDVLDFLAQAGFSDPKTYDYTTETSMYCTPLAQR